MVQLTGVGYLSSKKNNFPGCNQAFCWRCLFFSACLTLGLGFLMPTVLITFAETHWRSMMWQWMWNVKPTFNKSTLDMIRYMVLSARKTEPRILSLLGLHAWMPIFSLAVLNLFPRHPVPRLRCQNNRQNNSDRSTQNSGLFSSKNVWHERMCTYDHRCTDWYGRQDICQPPKLKDLWFHSWKV